MAKDKQQDKYDNRHKQNIKAYEKEIDTIYRSAIREAVTISASAGEIKPDTLFSFDDYPITRKRVENLLSGLKMRIEAVIVNGINAEWTLANNKNSELANRVFGDNVGKLTQAQYRRYYSTNDAAREAFKQRKESGLNLSDRVWNYTNQFKEEIEMGLDVGIRSGRSADELSRDLRMYLKEPDKLFRRVRDEHGQLQLSKKAAAYHPGRGVYRSSYKNARRLAATETNIAYRTADYLRWQNMDFVVGIRVTLSNNHPVDDICNELSAPQGSTANKGRGCYPKDFKFTGWHPHCRCFATSILKTQEELELDTEKLLKGEHVDGKSVNEVKDVPQEFKDWLEANEERAKRSTSVPYFISDNEKYLPNGYKNLYALKTPYATYAEYEAAMRYNKKHADYTEEVLKNIRELDKALPVMQGKIMNFTEADQTKCNPHFTDSDAKKEGYYINCQTCTMTYELRRRGFPVEAMPNKDDEFYDVWCPKNNLTWLDRFLNADGSRAGYISPSELRDTITAKVGFIEETTEETGRYELYLKWKGRKAGAHVMIVERQSNGNLLWFDPQTGKHGSSEAFGYYMERAVPVKISVLRIDDKIVNPKFAERFKKSIK